MSTLAQQLNDKLASTDVNEGKNDVSVKTVNGGTMIKAKDDNSKLIIAVGQQGDMLSIYVNNEQHVLTDSKAIAALKSALK